MCSFMLKLAFSTSHVQALIRMIWSIMVYVSLHHISGGVSKLVKFNGCQGLFMAKQYLYSQYSISVLVLLNSFLQSSVTNKRGCSIPIAGLANTTSTCCNTMHQSCQDGDQQSHLQRRGSPKTTNGSTRC